MSITVLAQAAPAPQPFNANFYIVAATVIPVLFVAIAVQSPTWESMIRRIRASQESLLASLAAIGLAITASFILIFAIMGEYVSASALYLQHITPGNGSNVLGALTALIVASAAGPALTLWGALFGPRKPSANTTRTPGQKPGPGKTDPEG